MLPKMSLVQCRSDLFDVACKDVCYESLSVRNFAWCRYCISVACKAHGLVRDDDGLYYVNAGQWSVTRHKESVRTRAPQGPAGASHGYLRIWGHTTGPTRQARERSKSLRVRESKYPCQVTRRTLDYTKVRYCGIAKGRMHIRLRLYKHK